MPDDYALLQANMKKWIDKLFGVISQVQVQKFKLFYFWNCDIWIIVIYSQTYVSGPFSIAAPVYSGTKNDSHGDKICA